MWCPAWCHHKFHSQPRTLGNNRLLLNVALVVAVAVVAVAVVAVAVAVAVALVVIVVVVVAMHGV